jgi:hypothetical protein
LYQKLLITFFQSKPAETNFLIIKPNGDFKMKNKKANPSRISQRIFIMTVIENTTGAATVKKRKEQTFGDRCRDLIKKESANNKRLLLNNVYDSPWGIEM